MYAKTLALTGAFAALASAIPMAQRAANKRDIVWVTETEEAIVTMPTTTTVWVDWEPTSKPAHHGHGDKHHNKNTHTVFSTVNVNPTPAAPSSTETPTTTSTSAAEVAPASPTEQPETYAAPTTSEVEEEATPTPSTTSTSTTSSSVYVAPEPTTTAEPTTSEAPAYTPPTTTEAPTTTSEAPAPPAYTSSAPSSGSDSGDGLSYGPASSGTSYTGDFTYYAVGMGACGKTSSESDKMVAISEDIFDAYSAESGGNPNKNPVCGKMVKITAADGSQHTAEVLDRCTGCAKADLDFPQTYFNTLTGNADGRAHGMKWEWA